LTWPDKNVPQDPGPLLNFIRDINEKYTEEISDFPIVVHCSAVIGRTGTLIVIDILINQIKREDVNCDIDISKVVQELRKQRSGMVQIECQYEFIYEAVRKFVDDTIHSQQPQPISTSNQVGVRSGNKNPGIPQHYENVTIKNQHTT
jgi:protein tyrosine phosphatase